MVRMNWAPEDYRAALSIYEVGGPLVEPGTGIQYVPERVRSYVWTTLAPLPPRANPHPVSQPRRLNNAGNAARAAWQQRAAA